jgi:hypothetical protein
MKKIYCQKSNAHNDNAHFENGILHKIPLLNIFYAFSSVRNLITFGSVAASIISPANAEAIFNASSLK